LGKGKWTNDETFSSYIPRIGKYSQGTSRLNLSMQTVGKRRNRRKRREDENKLKT
jgi:hypothetical protein